MNSVAHSGKESPSSMGFAHPPEWQTHAATWIGWPHNRTDWPGKAPSIPWVYGEIVRTVARGETVRILVNSRSHENAAKRLLTKVGVELSRLHFLHVSTNRGWTRDFGPIFVARSGSKPEIAIARFRFNGWAKYRDWQEDDQVPIQAANALDLRTFPAVVDGHEIVLEGGSIDVNGSGTIITTEECLLDQTVQPRNPGVSRQQLERCLADVLAIKNVLWLGRGIAGDDTHGHVDDLCRFVSRDTVVLCSESDPNDSNYAALAENYERLQGMRLEDGGRIQVVRLPMPAPLYFDGRRLPASYANFYISNAAVLVPTFNDANDRVALGILSELITDRPVVGIHAVDLVWGLGTIHCMTHEEPLCRPPSSND